MERAIRSDQLSMSLRVYPTTVGLPVVPTGGVHTHHLSPRDGEQSEGIVLAQVLLGGKGELGEVVERLEIVRMHTEFANFFW